MRPYDELVAEASAADVSGWDFAWLAGRATEERPSWAYQRLLASRLSINDRALDLQTGGGEVLDGALRLVRRRPRLLVATEGWLPNLERAAQVLAPWGVPVVGAAEDLLPFRDDAVTLVTARHPVVPPWTEVARVLSPGGTYLAQHVGPSSAFELVERFLGPLPEETRRGRHPDDELIDAVEAGLDLVDLRETRLRMEFHDIGAVVWFLRKVVWLVPGFTVERYDVHLRALDAEIRERGPFVAHSTRHLVELRTSLTANRTS